jgi:hypothetical protein
LKPLALRTRSDVEAAIAFDLALVERVSPPIQDSLAVRTLIP